MAASGLARRVDSWALDGDESPGGAVGQYDSPRYSAVLGTEGWGSPAG